MSVFVEQLLKVTRRIRRAVLALVLLGMSDQVAAAVEGWWQSWDSLLYVAVENGEARVFAAGILNPALVKGDLVNWGPRPRYWIWKTRILSCAIVPCWVWS